jgi:hypothetical protein
VIRLGELVMILDLHRQGLSVSAIARQLERDRKTVRKYIERGLDPPAYGPRQPRSTVVTPFAPYLRERIAAFPELTGSRLLREILYRRPGPLFRPWLVAARGQLAAVFQVASRMGLGFVRHLECGPDVPLYFRIWPGGDEGWREPGGIRCLPPSSVRC